MKRPRLPRPSTALLGAALALLSCAHPPIAAGQTAAARAAGVGIGRTSTAGQAAQSALVAQLGHEMALAGSDSGAYVFDITTGTPLFADRPTIPKPPASVEKLYTATTALDLMGPQETLATTVLGTGHMGAEGRWEGDLYLHGGGDPTFGSSLFVALHYGGQGATVSRLALELKRAGIRSVSGNVDGDESWLDSLRGEPASGFKWDPELEGGLSALSFNRGETGSKRGPHAPAAYAALQLRGAMRALGIVVHGGTAATAPPGATVLATVHSPSLARLLGLMLPPSDNFFAETLIKDLGARFGGAGTTAAGAAVVRKTMARFHVHPHLLDGSGLSHSDHTSPIEVVTVLATLAHLPAGPVLREDLAVAGHSGTLAERMRGTPASSRCQAKTGTLIGVSSLAGYCQSESGDLLAFAFLTDGIPIPRAHAIQDAMTVALARY